MGALIASTIVWAVALIGSRWALREHMGLDAGHATKASALIATALSILVGVLWP